MYTGYFNFRQEPFQITPDPGFLYLSPSHRESLASIIYGVRQRKGFISVVGEVGVGKTTILRSFLERVSGEPIKVIYLFNVDISFESLLGRIIMGLGQPVPGGDCAEMLNRLHYLLIEEYRNGNNVVVIIDEAQNMPIKTLESLRMLSNLETATSKLIQVVFSGQPEFERMLESNELRQLRQRIAVRATIRPLAGTEGANYILHRLAKASKGESSIFPTRVIRRIVRYAKGIPRTINILCDNCLITSFGNQEKRVKPSVLREICTDLGLNRSWRRRAIGACRILLLVLLGLALIYAVATRENLEQWTEEVAQRVAGTGSESAVWQNSTPARLPVAASVNEPGSVAGLRGMTIRTVRRGDTLAGMAAAHYGSVDARRINEILRHNPQIRNLNLIREGEAIRFPDR